MFKKIMAVMVCALLLTGCTHNMLPKETVCMPTDATISPEISVSTEPSMIESTPDGMGSGRNDSSSVAIEPTEEITEPVFVETEPVTTNPPQDETIPSVTNPQTEETMPPETEPEKSVSELVQEGVYMLKGSFGFYKGSVDMSDIQTITFSRTAPALYDECWNANVADTKDIRGYRTGNHVTIVGEHIYANSRCTYMFAGVNGNDEPLWSSLTAINGLELLNMSYATNMKMMFADSKVSALPGIGGWNVGSVTNMSMVFAWCTNLTSLDIANWDVSRVRTFSGMFQGHSHVGDMQLQYLDVSRWNTASAQEMNHVFYGCGLLTYIPIENWTVSGVSTFSHMFADCFSLQSLDLSKWNTQSVRSFDAFLNDCRSLVTIDVSGLDTATCNQFSQMFEACTSLQHIIGLETWDVSNASNYAFSETFHNCCSLQELNIGSWVATPDNTARMVKNCLSLTHIDMSGFDMSNNTHVTEMFMGCKNLTSVIGFSNWDLADLSEYESMIIDSGLVFVGNQEHDTSTQPSE